MAHISEAQVLQINRFYTGLYTFRNPLVIPVKMMGRRLIELYDALQSGTNMEITNTLTMKRRPGYVSYNTHTVSGIPLCFYSFKPSSFPGNVYPIVDTTTNVLYVPSGTTTPTSLISKTSTDQTNYCGIGPYLYMGNPKFQQKWDGPSGAQGVTNWGISASSVNNSTGPNTAGTGASSGTGTVWTNPGNVSSSVSFATSTVVLLTGTQNLLATNFGFSIPSTTSILGIQVSVETTDTVAVIDTMSVQLLKAGNPIGSVKGQVLNGGLTPFTFGGASDLWGTTFTYNDINQTNFGVQFQVARNTFNNTSTTPGVRKVQITIFGLGGPTVTLVGGSLTAQTGFQYQLCYGNSVSGHCSSPTPPSTVIKPSGQGVQISLVASTDPQVNQIRVFRTTDGGGQPFFELPTSPYPNTTANVTDNAPDANLQIANICPLPHFNDPPPAGLVDPVWFAGRLWGHLGNLLYFSSGPDITLGNGPEAWFPAYVFALPTTIIRKFPLPNGMLVVTTDDIFVVRGIDTTSFTVNEFMRDIGMRNWNAADSDGSNVYFYTTDRQMLLLNANGLQSISGAISDIIAAVDPTVAYVSIFRYTARNTLLFLGDGSTNIYPYNLNQEAWCPIQIPSNTAQAIGAIETAPGVFDFLVGRTTTNQTIGKRSLVTFSDEGTLYSCGITFGPIPFADSLNLAQIRDIAIATTVGQSIPAVSVLANEISGTFQPLQIASSEPPQLPPSQTFVNNLYSWKYSTLPELLNFIEMQIAWPAAATADELLQFAIGGTQTTGGSALGPPGQAPQVQGI